MKTRADENSIDTATFRRVLGRFASGVTVVTARVDGQVHGITVNALISVSLEPPLVLISLGNQTKMHQLLTTNDRFGVSVLAENQRELSVHFAGVPFESLDIPFVEESGVPLIGGGVAYLIARVVDRHPAGDHTLYIGRVEYLQQIEGRPLLFFASKYHRLGAELQPRRKDEDELGATDPWGRKK